MDSGYVFDRVLAVANEVQDVGLAFTERPEEADAAGVVGAQPGDTAATSALWLVFDLSDGQVSH